VVAISMQQETDSRWPTLTLQNPNRYSDVASRRLRRWLSRLLKELVPAGQTLVVRFTGERAIRRLNRDFRGRDRATDVLSFPGAKSIEGRHLGDIAISVPAARRQAAAAGHSVERELKILALHGVLHCLGHDHESDRGEMERLERQLRCRWINDDE
jgi:probable rRNA maturation factor